MTFWNSPSYKDTLFFFTKLLVVVPAERAGETPSSALCVSSHTEQDWMTRKAICDVTRS